MVSWGMMLRVDRWILLFMIAPVIGNFVFATALNKISYQIYEDTVVYKRVADYVNRMIHLADYAKDIRLTNIFRIMERKHKASVDSTLQVIDSYKKKSILYGWAYLFLSYTSIFEGVWNLSHTGDEKLDNGTVYCIEQPDGHHIEYTDRFYRGIDQQL